MIYNSVRKTLILISVVLLLVISYALISAPPAKADDYPQLKKCLNACIANYDEATWDRFTCVLDCYARYVDQKLSLAAAPFDFTQPSYAYCQGHPYLDLARASVTLVGAPIDTVNGHPMNTSWVKVVFQYTTDGITYTTIGVDTTPGDGWSTIWDLTGMPAGSYILLVTSLTEDIPESEWENDAYTHYIGARPIVANLESPQECLLPVGLITVPVDKFGVLAPWIALASIILVAAAIYFKHVKRREETQ